MATLLSADQMQQVLKARPDVETSVAATKQNAIRETTNWWNKFGKSELGANFFTSNPATAAYSAGNITAAATAPAPRPDDLMNIRSTIYGELGIPTMQQEQQKYYQDVLNYDTASEQGQLGIMNENKTMGVLRGEAAKQSWQRDIGRSSLARSLDAVNNKLSSAMTEAGDRYNIRAQEVGDVKNLMLQFPDAGIGFGDSTETMAVKVKKSNERKVVTDMFTQTFGYFPEGLSMDKMNKQLSKKYGSDKAYTSAKQALELSNIQSTITTRQQNANQSIIDAAAKKDKEAQDKTEKAQDTEQKKAQAEVDARSKFMDSIVQTYITKVGAERRQSKKDSLKEEARKKIEAQYPGWGWVSEKIG